MLTKVQVLMKKLVSIFAVLVVVGVVLLFVSSKIIGSGIKAGVETFGPEVTQTTITLESVELSAFSGAGSLKGLVVGNPEGFNTPHAIKLDGFSMKLQPMSVLSDKIVINEIIIDGPEFIYESGLNIKNSNISAILANIEAFTGESEAETEEVGSSKNVQIDLLRITGGQVKKSHKLLGGQSLIVPLPDIELKDIGADEDGSTFGETMKIVFQAINQGIISSLGNSGNAIGDQLKNIGEGSKKGLGGLLQGIKDKVDGDN
jgi:uncharacterized protein involved in outer membrane biogenesis